MSRPWRFLGSPWPFRAIAYVITSALLGLLLVPFAFVLVLLLPAWGIVLGALERRRVALVGYPIIANAHIPLSAKDWRIWAGVRTGEATTWREVACVLTTIVFGILATALLLAACVGVVILPVGMGIEFNRVFPVIGIFGLHWVITPPLNLLPPAATALAALVVLSYLSSGLAALQVATTRSLLRPRKAELARQVAMLSVSRMTLLEAFEAERRRIERNLHDGVQQQLVSLTMELAMAELDLDDASQAGYPVKKPRQAVAAAHAQAERALTDLRDTVRGIHPQALVKHGLAEAVRELIGRTRIEVDDDIQLDRRLPPAIEASAYFIISECLTNAVKHSDATAIAVHIAATDRQLTLKVYDNGVGNAEPDAGTGLRGLRERAEAHEGTLILESPKGGPTIVTATIPIAEASSESRAIDSMSRRSRT